MPNYDVFVVAKQKAMFEYEELTLEDSDYIDNQNMKRILDVALNHVRKETKGIYDGNSDYKKRGTRRIIMDLGKTTIQVGKGTKLCLDKLKLVEQEPYDHVIKRIISNFLDVCEEGFDKKTKELIQELGLWRKELKLKKGEAPNLNNIWREAKKEVFDRVDIILNDAKFSNDIMEIYRNYGILREELLKE